MGCASSKLFRKDFGQQIVFAYGDCPNHVVSLTSTTYGFLKLDDRDQRENRQKQEPIREILMDLKKRSPPREEQEIINAWELMKDLEEEEIDAPSSVQAEKIPNSQVLLDNMGERSPLKLFNRMGSPKRSKRFGGKENKGLVHRPNYSPKRVLEECNLPENLWDSSPSSTISTIGSAYLVNSECSRVNSGGFPQRRNFSPLFDPELVAFFEKELSEEEEQMKKMIFETPNSRRERESVDSDSIFDLFEKKCPPGGENTVVIYTTSLRGIRKTFEYCNRVRSTIQSYEILFIERDISMDLGFKEELRGLMGKKEVKVPVVFVKGRLIGGVDEVVKLEEDGKLRFLFDGIPRELGIFCDGCSGIRFVMCMECSGSCKVLDEDGKKKVRCGECNENGLIQCPICC